MPTFLWVGKSFQYPSKTVPTPAARVDKYCWNSPGNWKILTAATAGQVWVATDLVPKDYQDTAYIGNPFNASNIPGWESAKCPLLFGGVSGGEGFATWSHTNPGVTGVTAPFSAGSTWTSSIYNLYANLSSGWSFDVALGAGISGYALSWCIAKDTEASPGNPTTSADYTAQVSAGFRNPANPLRLKVMYNIDFIDNAASWYPTPLEFSAGIGVPTEELSSQNGTSYRRASATDPLSGNSYTSRGFVFDGVKSWTMTSPGWCGNQASVLTAVNFQSGFGQDLIINGGSYRTITMNTTIVPQINVAPWNDWVTGTAPMFGYVHGKLLVKDVVAQGIEYAKCGTVTIDGGTAGLVKIHQFPYKLATLYYSENELLYPYEGNGIFNTNLQRYWDQLPTYVTCGYSGGYVWADTFRGITLTIPTEYRGTLELSNRVVSMRGQPDVVINGVTLADRIFDDKHYCLFGRPSRAYQQFWYLGDILRTDMRQRVYVGGPRQSATTPIYTATIPTINIKSSYDNVDSEGRFTEKWQPWQLMPLVYDPNFENTNEGYGYYYLNINTINNDAGLIVGPLSKTLKYRIGQVYCKNHGTFDYSIQWNMEPKLGEYYGANTENQQYYSNPNIFVGGLTGASGDRLVGGVVMQDKTAAIQVTPDYLLYNAAILPNGTNIRSAGIAGASTWTTFTPTTTSE